jgi:hypothetical protein
VFAVQHGERPVELGEDRDLVAQPPSLGTGEQARACRAVGAQDVLDEAVCRHHRSGSEEARRVAACQVGVDCGGESDTHGWIRQERLFQVRRIGDRRSAEEHEPGGLGKRRGRFDNGMATHAPANEHRILRARRTGEVGDQRGEPGH